MAPKAPALDEDEIDWQAMEIRSACEGGKLEDAQALIEEGVSMKYVPPGASWTIVGLGSYRGHADVVAYFAGKKGGPKIEDTDPHGYQALMWAAASGSERCVRTLIDKGAQVNVGSETGESPLMVAAASGHKTVVRILLDADADLNALDNNGWRAVQKAAWWGHDEALAELLLEQTPSPELRRNLFTACMLQGHAHCKEVLESKAGPRSFPHLKCELYLGTHSNAQTILRETRAAISASLGKVHGVQNDDVAVPEINPDAGKNDAGKPIAIAYVEIRIMSSSPVGVMNDLREQLNDSGSAIRKSGKLGVDPASSTIKICWPTARLAKVIGEKFGEETPALKDVDQESINSMVKAVEDSQKVYDEIRHGLQEAEPDQMSKLCAVGCKARFFIEKDIPPPDEEDPEAAENAEPPEPEFESVMMLLDEGRTKQNGTLREDWPQQGQPGVQMKRYENLVIDWVKRKQWDLLELLTGMKKQVKEVAEQKENSEKDLADLLVKIGENVKARSRELLDVVEKNKEARKFADEPLLKFLKNVSENKPIESHSLMEATKTLQNMEKPSRKEKKLSELRREATKAHAKLKDMIASRTLWALAAQNDLEKVPLDSPDRVFTPEAGPAKGGVALDPGIKAMDRIDDKAKAWQRPDMEEPPYGQVFDASRISLTYTNIETLLAGLAELQKVADVCFIDNGFRAPGILGYSSVTVGVRLPLAGGDTHIAEIQLCLKAMNDARAERGQKFNEEIMAIIAALEVPAKDHEQFSRLVMRVLEETEGHDRRMRAHDDMPTKPGLKPAPGKK